MAITRSQIARQLLAEGGSPNPRKPFRSGDLAARDDSYGTLSGSATTGFEGSPEMTGQGTATTETFGGPIGGGDDAPVTDTFRANQLKKQIDLMSGNTRFNPSFIASIFGPPKQDVYNQDFLDIDQLGMSGKDLTRSQNIQRALDKFQETGRLSQSEFETAFGSNVPKTTSAGDNEMAAVMANTLMTPKVPSDIESQRSDMQEFVQRFTLPERFRLSNGGITGTETAMKEARQAYDKYKKSGGKLSFDKFIALGDEGVAKFFAEGGRTGFEGSPELAGQGTQTAETYGGPPGGDNEGSPTTPPTTFGGGITTNVTGFGPGGRPAPKTITIEEILALNEDEDEDEKNKSESIGMNTKNTPRPTGGYEIKSGMPGSAEKGDAAFQKTMDEYFPQGLADGGPIRQAYGLGSLVKSITKPIKKVLKSDVGKAALIGAAAFGIPGTQFGGLFGRQAIGGGAKGIFGGYGLGDFFKQQAISERGGEIVFGKSPFRKALSSLASPRGAMAGIVGTSILAGALTPEQEEQVDSLSSRISDRTGIDVEKIRKEVQSAYASGDLSGLKSKYPFLIPTEAAKAEGGLMRLGYEDGSKDAVTPQEMFPDNIDLDKIGPRKTKSKLRKMPEFKGKEVKKRKVAEAAEGGLMNLGGNEMDLRGGGFVPIGVAEKADDVPARLSKNEFVFTADAVRAAGGGSVDRGADLMYKTMKQLENQVA